MVASGILLLIVIGGGALLYMQLRSGHTGSASDAAVVRKLVCSDDLITRASTAIKSNDTSITTIRDEVMKQKDYSADGNCVFIVAQIDLLQYDTKAAGVQATQLKKVYTSYSPVFTVPTLTPNELDQAISQTEAIVKERDANIHPNGTLDTKADALIGGQ